jgi:hypothetical protein
MVYAANLKKLTIIKPENEDPIYKPFMKIKNKNIKNLKLNIDKDKVSNYIECNLTEEELNGKININLRFINFDNF